MWRDKNRLFITIVLCIFGLFAFNLTRQSSNESKEEDILISKNKIHLKHIRHSSKEYAFDDRIQLEKHKKNVVHLFAGTPFFGMPVTNERFLGHCSVKDHCLIVGDQSTADAVLYHGPDYVTMSHDLRSDQIAVLWLLESPISHKLFQDYRKRINWTMTYRHDADVWLPYGIFKETPYPIKIDYDEIWNAKNGMVVWLVSNCLHRNGRLDLVHAMQAQGLSVDIYGGCGNKTTPNNCEGVSKQSDKCVAELFKPYKFAISFENSICNDYITEKFFEVLQKRYTVPIVMQRHMYQKTGAPNDSYIAVDDFKDINELNKYLYWLSENKSEYLKYHKWRELYTVESDYFSIEETGFCQLCKKIMKRNFIEKYYENPSGWHINGICEQPQDGFVNNFLKAKK